MWRVIYRQLETCAAVRQFVECYWTLHDPSGRSAAQRIVPDGRPELIFNLGKPFENQGEHGWKLQPRCFFVGQLMGPLLVRPSGPTSILGIRFRPHGAARLFGSGMHSSTGQTIPLEVLAPELLRQLDCLQPLPAGSALTQALDRILRPFADDSSGSDRRIPAAVNEFAVSGGLVDVKAVAVRVGLSTRQLERRFREEIGMGPKLFCRMQRFQRVFRAMEDPGANWLTAALECGYYDQSHLIRDFRDFAGDTPAAILSSDTDLAAQFLQYRPVSHLSKTATASAR